MKSSLVTVGPKRYKVVGEYLMPESDGPLFDDNKDGTLTVIATGDLVCVNWEGEICILKPL